MPNLLSKSAISASTVKDPVARFLTERLKFTPIGFGLLVLLADAIVDDWLGLRFQVFFATGSTPGLLQDASALLTDFVVNPLICGTYLWTSRWAADLFQRLKESKVLDREDLIENADRQRQALFKRRGVSVAFGLIALFNTLSQVASYKGWVPWRTIEGYLYLHDGNMSFFRAPFWFIVLYAAIYILYNAGISVYIVNRLFANRKVRLQLLHPDGCGGLGSLAEYASAGVILIVPIGALTSASMMTAITQNTLAVAYPVWLMLFTYIVMAPLLLILPLYSAHKAMVRTKYAELHEISEAYDREYCQISF